MKTSTKGGMSIKLDSDLSLKLGSIKEKTGQSVSFLTKKALDYFIPAIERGEFAIINGKLVRNPKFTDNQERAAAAREVV